MKLPAIMAIIRKISEPLEDDWKKSPVMIKLMARDKARDEKVMKAYREKLKKQKV